MDSIQIAALILMITSILPLLVCLIKMYLLKKYKSQAIITTALVTASEKRRGFKNSTYYFLDIKYRLVDTSEQYSAQTISWKKYKAGDSMPLMYLISNPGNFKTDFGESLKWLLPLSIILIGLIAWFCYWLLNSGYYYQPPSPHP